MPASKPRQGSRPGAAFLVLLTVIMIASPARADDDMSRLRDALRSAVSALRDAQDENASLTAKVGELSANLADRQKAIDSLKAQLATNAAAAAQIADAQNNAKQAQDQLSQTQAVLKKWQDGYDKAADIARSRDAAARSFELRYNQTAGQLNECSAKNEALEKLGTEMLGKVGRCSFGDFLAAHEPVTQIYRARLESLNEAYQNKLRDNSYPAK